MFNHRLIKTVILFFLMLSLAYGAYVYISVKHLGVIKMIAYTAYPEKLMTEEYILIPNPRSMIINEAKNRTSESLLRALSDNQVTPLFIISWANLEENNKYDSEKLKYLLALLKVFNSKGFGLHFLSKSGCSSFHEASILKDMNAIKILRKTYRVNFIAGNLEADLEACRYPIKLDQFVQ